MITAAMLERRIANFWGYGSLSSPVWIVGMEEGMGNAKYDELFKRLLAADGKQTIDVRKDMKDIPGHMRFYDPGRPIGQASLRYPIALYLRIKNGLMPNPLDVRAYQTQVAGDADRPDSAILELMPLPAKSTSEDDWPYATYKVSGLETRAAYLAKYKTARVEQLRDLLGKHQPELVIFYSLQYKDEWTKAMGVEPQSLTDDFYAAQSGSSTFCIMPHGARPGMSYARVEEFASRISWPVFRR